MYSPAPPCALPVAVPGVGRAQQVAQVGEVGLRALALVQVSAGAVLAPFGDELLGGHGVEWRVVRTA